MRARKWCVVLVTVAGCGGAGGGGDDTSGGDDDCPIYGTAGGDLFMLDARGNELHRVPLGGRGAMPVPTIADADGDGDLDIIVSLKDAIDRMRSVLIFEVAGSSTNCLLWPTGRGNYRRDGFVPPS